MTIEEGNASYVPCRDCEGDGCIGPNPAEDQCKRCGGTGCEPKYHPMSGPSREALKHGVQKLGAGHEASLGVEAIERAHDPDLGLDRSVCLRDVLAVVRGVKASGWDYPAPHPSSDLFADAIEREFAPERRKQAR
jgi:hypothetical protein